VPDTSTTFASSAPFGSSALLTIKFVSRCGELLAKLARKNSRKFAGFASFAAYLPSSALSAFSAVKAFGCGSATLWLNPGIYQLTLKKLGLHQEILKNLTRRPERQNNAGIKRRAPRCYVPAGFTKISTSSVATATAPFVRRFPVRGQSQGCPSLGEHTKLAASSANLRRDQGCP